jgi:Hint domain
VALTLGVMTISDNKEPRTGIIPNEGFTNDPTPKVTLYLDPSAVKGDTITIDWTGGGTKTIKLTAKDIADGSVSFTVPKLTSNGAYIFTASNSDGATYGPQAMVLDTTKPIVGGIVVADDNVLNKGEDASGFMVTGTLTGGPSIQTGDKITVTITDKAGDTVTAVGTVGAVNDAGPGVYSATWSVDFGPGSVVLGSSNYKATVTYTNDAGVSSANSTDKFTAICFMPGTLIRTPGGEAAVETLKAGDLVMTTDGKAAPVAWLGRQTVSMIFSDTLRTLPIRIKAGALGDNIPSRDLLLSPDHAVLVDGVLIQAGALVNGRSIVREDDVPQVFTYYHVELGDHSLILAENTPAETFINNVNRLAFDNWAEHEVLYPEGQDIVEMPYARAKAQRQVPRAIRERLARRGHALAELAATAAQSAA